MRVRRWNCRIMQKVKIKKRTFSINYIVKQMDLIDLCAGIFKVMIDITKYEQSNMKNEK